MSDFPAPPIFQGRTVTSKMEMLAGGNPTSGAWPSANLAIFVPFRIFVPMLIDQFFTCNGATAAGNIDVGVYSPAGTKIISTGAVAQAGTSTTQAISVTDMLLQPGCWYLALSASLATATFARGAATAIRSKVMGMAQMASAHPLPATATFATVANAYLPKFGFVENSRF